MPARNERLHASHCSSDKLDHWRHCSFNQRIAVVSHIKVLLKEPISDSAELHIHFFFVIHKDCKKNQMVESLFETLGCTLAPVCAYTYIRPLFPCTQSQMLSLIRY